MLVNAVVEHMNSIFTGYGTPVSAASRMASGMAWPPLPTAFMRPQLPSSPKRPSRTFGRLLAMFSRMSDCT